MVEDDCEDQGYGRIADGCASCRTDEVIVRHGVERRKPVALVKQGGYWRCPCCGGSYGEVRE